MTLSKISLWQKSLSTPSKSLLAHSKRSLRLIHIYTRSLYPEGRKFDAKRSRESFVQKQPPRSSPQLPRKIYTPPNIVLFHNPGSKTSVRAKQAFEDAQTSFPNSHTRIGPPLPLNFIVHERLPTANELYDAYFLLEDQNWTKFLNLATLTYRTHPTNAVNVLEIIQSHRERRLLEAQGEPISAIDSETEVIVELDDPSDDSLSDVQPIILPPTHSLFGTECFAWPLILWNSDFAQINPGHKTVVKRLHKFARLRDNILSPEEREAAKEEAKEKARQARWESRPKEVSPDEGETLEWYRESSNRKRPDYRENRRGY